MQMSLPRRQGNRYFLLGGPVDQAKDRSHPVRIAMAKRALRLIRWSKTDHAELQRHSRSKTPVVKVAKAMKRTERSIRLKAASLGFPIGHQR
jgi:hypothetical protein